MSKSPIEPVLDIFIGDRGQASGMTEGHSFRINDGSGYIDHFHANDRKKSAPPKSILAFYQDEQRVAGIFPHCEIRLTGRRKFYILRTVIKINLDKNKNYYYFCKVMTDLLEFRRFN